MNYPFPPSQLPEDIRNYLGNLVRAIEQADRSNLKQNAANGSVLLASPAGKVYTVAVDDAGVIVTTLVYG